MEESVIYIGKKGIMSYVLAIVTQFNKGAKEVTVKARGKAISRAVDVVEITRNRFITDAKVGDIKISTEHLEKKENEEGASKVSAIEIKLTR